MAFRATKTTAIAPLVTPEKKRIQGAVRGWRSGDQ